MTVVKFIHMHVALQTVAPSSRRFPHRLLGQKLQAPACLFACQVLIMAPAIQGILGNSHFFPSIKNALSWHPSVQGASMYRLLSLVAMCSACFHTFINSLESRTCRFTKVGISSCRCWIKAGANDSMMCRSVTPLYSEDFVTKTYFWKIASPSAKESWPLEETTTILLLHV